MKTYLKLFFDAEDFRKTEDINTLAFTVEVETLFGEFRENLNLDTPFGVPVHKKYTLTHGDKFYFLPGVTIPRVKLKDIANSHKIRTVRDAAEATRIFIGSDTLSKMSETSWEYRIKTSAIRPFIESAKESGHIDEYYYEKVLDVLEWYNEEYIISDYRTINLLNDTDIPYHIDWNDYESSSAFYNVDCDNDLIQAVTGKELYIEDSLLEYVNGKDAVIIDETMFDTLCEMFNSSDNDNWILAMEIMANCQYKQSILYLGLLFYKHGYQIDQMSTKRHVNFKSLVNYLGIPYISGLNKDQVVDLLVRKNSVTEENMTILLKMFNDELTGGGDSNFFKVKIVAFSDVIDKLLNKELTLKVKNDYKPVMIELAEAPIIETNGTTESEFNAFGF